MRCPTCGTGLTEVKETRPYRTVFTRRVRLCYNKHSFTTYEGFDRPQAGAPLQRVEPKTKAHAVRSQGGSAGVDNSPQPQGSVLTSWQR